MPERPSTPDAACPMTLKQLEAFYWAATCASFAVAAQRVHLSMSSLSKRIAELELSLGERLFDRSGHRATLTDTGRRLVPRARDLLQAADALRHDLGQHTGLHGTCRLGVGELSALTWLPRLVRRVQADQARPSRVHVANDASIRKPAIGVRRIGDEKHIVHRSAQRIANAVDDASPADRGQPFRRSAESTARSAGDDRADHTRRPRSSAASSSDAVSARSTISDCVGAPRRSLR